MEWELQKLNKALELYDDRYNYYSDADIEKAVDEYDELLIEAENFWKEANIALTKSLENALADDTSIIENCKLEYLGDSNYQLTSDNTDNLLTEKTDFIAKLNSRTKSNVDKFINDYLINDLPSIEMRLGEAGTLKIIMETFIDATYIDDRHMIVVSEVNEKLENEHTEILTAYFYIPNFTSAFNNEATYCMSYPSAPYNVYGVRPDFFKKLMQNSAYAEQIHEIKNVIINALENADNSNVRGWSSVIKRAKNLEDKDINNHLAHNLERIGKKFAEDYQASNTKAFTQLDRLWHEYYYVPEEVFGDDVINLSSDMHDIHSKINFKAIGWTQERIDEINYRFERILNKAKSIYSELSDNAPKNIEIPLDDLFISNLTYFKLAYETQGVQFKAIKKVLDVALANYTIKVTDAFIAEASDGDGKFEGNYCKLLGVEL